MASRTHFLPLALVPSFGEQRRTHLGTLHSLWVCACPQKLHGCLWGCLQPINTCLIGAHPVLGGWKPQRGRSLSAVSWQPGVGGGSLCPQRGESEQALGCPGRWAPEPGAQLGDYGSPMEAAWDVGGGPGGLDTSGTRGEGRVCGCFGGLANPWDPHPLPGFLLPTST